MPGSTKSRWPLAFFILNAFAVAVWLFMTGVFEPGTVVPRSFAPHGGELDADAIEQIDVVFDAPLDPASVGPHALRLHPPAAGAAELADERTLRYRLHEKLQPATNYRLSWSDALRGRRGQAVGKEFYAFATARPALVAAEQAGFDDKSYTILLTFNQPVRADTLTTALSSRFSDDDRFRRDDSRVRVITSGAARAHRLRVSAETPGWLVLHLAAGMTAVAGNLGLENDLDLVWRLDGGDDAPDIPDWAGGGTVRVLKPELAFQGMEADWDDDEAVVIVRASSPLDSANAAKLIAIEPPVQFSCVSYWGGMKIVGEFEPGRQYSVTLRAGLSAGAAGNISEAVTRNVWFDDRPPSLDFSFGGGYLLPNGLLKLPVTSTNVDKFTLRLRRLYPNNLVETALGSSDARIYEQYAGEMKEAEIATGGKRNEKTETLVDLRELIDGRPGGIYGVEIRSAENTWRRRQATVVISNIGLGARLGRDQLFAWTMALGAGEPLSGSNIEVYSDRRQLLASGVTGDDGTISLALPPLPDGESPMLVVASAKGETTFVHLANHRNARGAALGGGAAHPDAYQAFVATDRGVYRGGETVLASALIRDRDLRDVPVMPVEIALTAVDGKVRHAITSVTDAHGRLAARLPLPRDIAAGLYEVRARVPGHAKELGRAGLRVADYIPETLRLSVSLTADHDRESAIAIRAQRLAGGEAGGLRGTVMAEYRPSPFRPDGWKGWTFGDQRIENRNAKTVERRVVTDMNGEATAEWTDPIIETSGAVSLRVLSELLEPGGRAIGESADAVLHQSPFYLGVKMETPRPQAGSETSFLLAAVAPDGSAFSSSSDWHARLYRVEHNGLLRRRSDGRLVYDWQRREILEEEASGVWDGARGHLTFSSPRGGGYRLVVESGTGKAATLDFHVYGGDGGWSGADPEALVMEADAPRHPVDSIAKVTVNAPFAGRAVVAVEGDRVLKHWVKTFREGENTLEIPVEETMRPNAYVTVTLVRAVGPEERWRPHRAVGAVNLEVDNADRRVAAAIDAPDSVAPGGEVAVTVRVTDAEGGNVAGAAVVLWGVDEGILGLTGYRTPSPWEHFYRRRRLSVFDSDMYSRLAPELAAWRQGRDPLPGGSDGASDASRRLNPIHAERVRAAVIYRDDLVTDETGAAEALIRIPEIASKMRLMAWATVGRKMGSGEKEIDVKAPVSFLASWPRFAAPGDEFQVAVTLLNRSGEETDVTFSANAESGIELTPAVHVVRIPDGGTRQVLLAARATETGTARAVLRAGVGDDAFTQTMELAVRPPVLFQRRSGVEEVAPGDRARFVLADDLFPENGRLGLTVGGSPQIKLAGTLEYLVGYPYACGEQTASRLAALTALPDLLSLSRPGQLGAQEAAELARGCMERLAQLQASDGGFRMWPGGEDAEFWLSAQALYLLEECGERNLSVPTSLLENCRGYLARRLDDQVALLTKDPQSLEPGEVRYASGEDAALACLALARGNALRRSWLVRMNQIALERAGDGRPLASQALAFLCHATLLAGDPDRARELFDLHGPGGSAAVAATTPFANAAWLAAGLRLGVPRAALASTATRLERELPDSYRRWSTRENVWVLLALGKYWQRFRPAPESRAWMTVNGEEREFALSAGSIWPELLPGAAVEAEARGADPLYFVWTAEGVPASGKAREEDAGMTARRSVFAPDGEPLEAPYVLRQGEVYRIRLEIAGEADDLVVADLLPAGLEVENPRLKGRDGERAEALHITQVERRDDRLLLFGSVQEKGVYEYLCRAVTPGSYVWPALDAGRMYDSETRSVHGEGTLVVTAAGKAEND